MLVEMPSWLKCRVRGLDIAGSMPVLGIKLSSPWERQLTLIFKQVLCVVWMMSTGIRLTAAYTEETKTC